MFLLFIYSYKLSSVFLIPHATIKKKGVKWHSEKIRLRRQSFVVVVVVVVVRFQVG